MTAGDWLNLQCPDCRCRFRIRAEHAHLRGRCPECGRRIEPPRSAELPASMDGVTPIVEDWPTPAQIEDAGKPYALAVDKPEENAEQTYGLGPAAETPAVQHDPGIFEDGTEGPYSVAEGAEPTARPGVVDRLSRAELNPERAPPPPAHPFVQGVYSFPWRRESIGLWLLLAAQAMVVLFLLTIFRWLAPMMASYTAASIAAVAGVLSFASLCILFIASGSYASLCFLHVLEGSAAGNDQLARPDWIFSEGLVKLALLTWLFFGACVPGYLIGLAPALPPWTRWALMPASGALLFPLVLLSALNAINPWMIFDAEFAQRAFRRPLVLIRFYPGWLLIVAVVGLFVGGTVWFIQLWLVPIAALMAAACWLIAARLNGRAAWMLTYEAPRLKKPKKEKEKPPAQLKIVEHPAPIDYRDPELNDMLGKPLAELEGPIPFAEKQVELKELAYDPAAYALDSGEPPDLVHRFRRGDGARIDFLIKGGRIATVLVFRK